MDALRQIVDRKSITSVHVPEEFGDQVEIIILPLREENKMSATSETMLKLQEQSGFATHVLADENEDVWNDL